MDILNQTNSFILTIMGEKKICSDKIFLDSNGDIYSKQWFSDQLILVAKQLGIIYIDPITNSPYSNLYLGLLIKTHGSDFEEGVLNSEKLVAYGLTGDTIEVSLNSYKNNVIMQNYDNYKIDIENLAKTKSDNDNCKHGALVNINNSCYMDVVFMLLLLDTPENCFQGALWLRIKKKQKNVIMKSIKNIYENINSYKKDINIEEFKSHIKDEKFKSNSQGDAIDFLGYLMNEIFKDVKYEGYNKQLIYKLKIKVDKNIVNCNSKNEVDIINPYNLVDESDSDKIDRDIDEHKNRFIITQPIDYRAFIDKKRDLNIENLLCIQELSNLEDHKEYIQKIDTFIINDAKKLIFQLSRKEKDKINTFPIIPNEKIQIGGRTIKLIGIISFSGEDKLGHYYGYYLCNSEWYKYDDTATTKLYKISSSLSHLLVVEKSIINLGVIFFYCKI